MISQHLQDYYLQQMGVELWELRPPKSPKNQLLKLAAEVSSCRQCSLYKTRTQTAFARGNPNATLMIIGEAPGFYEDKQGLPFVGKAGLLLNKMLKSIELSEDDVYIANVLKCRPPNNRDPSSEEIDQCAPYLAQQILTVSPRMILALGRFAGQFLLKAPLSLHQMRSEIHHYQGIPVLVSFHPAYLLRQPQDKKKAQQDLFRLKELINSD